MKNKTATCNKVLLYAGWRLKTKCPQADNVFYYIVKKVELLKVLG